MKGKEGATKSYRWQFGKLWEISAFPLTKLIMEIHGIASPELPGYVNGRIVKLLEVSHDWVRAFCRNYLHCTADGD
ncbi:MAG: hypothetical protein A2X82_07120 [Geobacteraceae bacterium GWC2_55_20]|nr:MAG: hypothetical protein A2X82_07120 [Geobacteraceae bacterium GWC2_55_20]OGU18904.1 MAG: hypothetical protein A2X85_00660 [Geobacteraceae bacterium GWF2_54_21]HBA72390.1 hypothetical protein [Geobacter sp.]HCE66707.1 hypothetical protein [Geobacter sp.]